MPAFNLLISCLALSFYQTLSSELIHYIFSIPFLDQIDEEIEYGFSKNYVYMVRSTLMNLNRTVCLDYPEEKIPWFHEKYCKDQSELLPSPVSAFHQDVHNTLGVVLGNSNHISLNKKISYGYNIDLEFALDYDGKPIPVHERCDNKTGQKSSINQREIYKKVAIVLRNERCYSSGTSVLKGHYQLEKRHLEILGYVVVEIPQRTWNSMAVATKKDKSNLLRSLIYKGLLKNS